MSLALCLILTLATLCVLAQARDETDELLQVSKRRNRQIIFRLDDVQDYWPGMSFMDGDASGNIIKVFIKEGLPLSIGVIGGQKFGDDRDLMNTIKDAVDRGSEVFNHGDDATTKFNEISKGCAKTHIQRAMLGRDGSKLPFCYTTFVPHQNRFARSTLEALESLGYKAISAGREGRYPMKFNVGASVAQMPFTAETAEYDLSARAEWRNRVDDIIPKCKAAPKHEPCIVMMHPMEFSDWKKGHVEVQLHELKSLLRDVKSRGWEVTTFAKFLGVENDCAKQTSSIKDEC